MTGVYDLVVQRIAITVTVIETITEEDQIEIVCPDVIHPGEYFNCVADIPTGYDLEATIEMTDDLQAMVDSSPRMVVPSK